MRGLFGEQPFSPHCAVPRDESTPREKDEALRRRVVAEAARTLEQREGRELTSLERDALAILDAVLLRRFADTLPPQRRGVSILQAAE